jgi:hypothetical protein
MVLGIPLRGTEIEANSWNSLPNLLAEEKTTQNSVPNHSADEKTTQKKKLGSGLHYFVEFRSVPFQASALALPRNSE